MFSLCGASIRRATCASGAGPIATLLLVGAVLFGCGDPDGDPALNGGSVDAGPTARPPGPCGNGVLNRDETCDDNNDVGGDGCSSMCELEEGFVCDGQPSQCAAGCREHADCDDGLFCNGLEACEDAVCVPGTAPLLDDEQPCTVDACDEERDLVVHLPDHTVCDDDNACNGAEQCSVDDGCLAGEPPSVDDDIPCTTDVCDPRTGEIRHLTDDATCNDSNDCTVGTCVAGVGCTERFICECRADTDCDDGNPCTDESCGSDGSCVYAHNAGSCDDGAFCNGEERCYMGACISSGDPCEGGGDCADTCNEEADTCLLGAGAACTDDGIVCTDDLCDGEGECTHPANTATCDDGLFCNGTDVCSDGVCGHQGDPCEAMGTCMGLCQEDTSSCVLSEGDPCTDDDNACTADFCTADGTCRHEPICCADDHIDEGETCGEPGLDGCDRNAPCYNCTCDCRPEPTIAGSEDSIEPIDVAISGTRVVALTHEPVTPLSVVDFSDPESPAVLRPLPLLGASLFRVEIVAEHALVLQRSPAHLWTVHVGGSEPNVVNRNTLPGVGTSLSVADGQAYVTTSGGSSSHRLFVFDVRGQAPMRMGDVAIDGPAVAVTASGSNVYVALEDRVLSFDHGLRLLGSSPLPGGTAASVTAALGHVFVGVTGHEWGLHVFDVSDPESLVHVAEAGPANVEDALLVGEHLLSAVDGTVHVLDISEPASPTPTGTAIDVDRHGIRGLDSDDNLLAVGTEASGVRFLTICN